MHALRTVARLLIGALVLFAGVMHLTPGGRKGFQVAVPDWVPLEPETTVVASGVVEIALGVAVIASPQRCRSAVGVVLAAFFVAVFPGNIAQWQHHRNSPGMRTDRARFIRLWLQPVLVLWALWATRSDARR
ncbi:MAG: hypothetical protein ACOYBP_05510 [Microbacteriaceae bacterium]